jgi:copper homeostasis protein
MQLEVCCYSVEDAIAAENLGADRIELCANAAVGGVLPSIRSLEIAAKKLTIPTHIMIRPRGGNFFYSAAETDAMIQGIHTVKQLGFSGIVLGALLPNNTIDIATVKYLVQAANDLHITFHKAFDRTNCSLATAKQIAQLGCHNILTTLCKTNIDEALPALIEFKKTTNKIPEIIACGGIRSKHIATLKQTGIHWIHASPLTNQGVLDKQELQKMIQLL